MINDIHIPFSFAKKHGVVIKALTKEGLSLVQTSSTPLFILNELRRAFQTPIFPTVISDDEFQQALTHAYESDTEHALHAASDIESQMDLTHLAQTAAKVTDLLDSADDAPVIRLINAVLSQAIKQASSDIHIETFADKVAVRFRIDGILKEILDLPANLASVMTSRIKIMAKLNIAEKRLPQDGRITLTLAGREVDVRVSTIPTHYGERVVLRVLDKNSAPLDLSRLGMNEKTLKTISDLVHQPHGILLVTGPTGSGKTTTLYASLMELNQQTQNILTVEDPIEYYLPGIGQTPVNTKIGMTFARGLRAILRQDPDVVMVGEIRDLETVQVAIQASLTGHLVLSTLHTNSAIGAIARLRDMGAEPYLLASTLIGVIAQRLVRVLCEHCKKPTLLSESEKIVLGMEQESRVTIYQAGGCEQCQQTGFQGRMGIYEVIPIDNELRDCIHDNASELDMEKRAHTKNVDMKEAGWQCVLSGHTTIDEVLRVINL